MPPYMQTSRRASQLLESAPRSCKAAGRPKRCRRACGPLRVGSRCNCLIQRQPSGRAGLARSGTASTGSWTARKAGKQGPIHHRVRSRRICVRPPWRWRFRVSGWQARCTGTMNCCGATVHWPSLFPAAGTCRAGGPFPSTTAVQCRPPGCGWWPRRTASWAWVMCSWTMPPPSRMPMKRVTGASAPVMW